ncbi:hypothetical protein [Bradyrhizobium genosp. P]|uniref:hypothetical protein n=1 Tax=Bradyrhizobium genosp. P TaxID=83641 RepID=UPI003CF3DDBA
MPTIPVAAVTPRAATVVVTAAAVAAMEEAAEAVIDRDRPTSIREHPTLSAIEIDHVQNFKFVPI